MIAARVIPCLLLDHGGLVKTVKFKQPRYLGDPINIARLFNDKEVDELMLLDITASRDGHEPQFDLIGELASECFMPLAYGGGLRTVADAKRCFSLGVEKVSLNTAAVETPALVSQIAEIAGSQSVTVSIDVRKSRWSRYDVCTRGGRKKTGLDPIEHARQMQARGAGEILLTSIDRDGTMAGYDLELVRRVADAVGIPVVASGGAGSIEDLGRVVRDAGASAAAAGSLFVFHGPHHAVLINYPSQRQLADVLPPQP